MTKIASITILALLLITLCACAPPAPLANLSTRDNGQYQALIWGDRTYVPFCAVPNTERGRQIGIVDGDQNDQVYEYKSYPTDQWVVSFYDSGEMDASMLMREINVTEIPDGLQSDYEWNN